MANKHLPPDLADVRHRIIQWLNAVESGTLRAAQAGALSALISRLLDLAKFAHEVGEAKELEQRIADLETRLAEGVRR